MDATHTDQSNEQASGNMPSLADPDARACAFDYDQLDAELRESLRNAAGWIRTRIVTSMEDIIGVGRALRHAKEQLAHGQFVSWVESEIGIKIRSAQRYMGVAGLAERKGVTVTCLLPGVAYQLAAKSTPPEIIDGIIERAAEGELITEEDVANLLRGRKEQKSEPVLADESAAEPVPTAALIDTDQAVQTQEQESPDPARIESVARELLSDLGEALARRVLVALEQEAQAVLNKLREILPQVTAATVPSENQRAMPSTQKDAPDIPPFLDRRDKNRGEVR